MTEEPGRSGKGILCLHYWVSKFYLPNSFQLTNKQPYKKVTRIRLTNFHFNHIISLWKKVGCVCVQRRRRSPTMAALFTSFASMFEVMRNVRKHYLQTETENKLSEMLMKQQRSLQHTSWRILKPVNLSGNCVFTQPSRNSWIVQSAGCY